ncbi:MAG: AraC family transcriptional regulator [Rhizorhabdus sp.]
MQRLYSSTGTNPVDARKNWEEMTRREFYDGDLDVPSGQASDIMFEKALRYPISLTHLVTRSTMSYRRSSQHIRANKVGFRVIWFVKQGSLKIVRAQGACTIKAGEAGILDSNVPFSATLQNDGLSPHESYQAIVPPDMFLGHLQEADKFIGAFSLQTPEGGVIQRLLELLVEDGDRLSRQAAKPLVESLLEAIADNLRARDIDMPRRQRLVDRRLMDIENYILMNLTDPDLCYDKVASSCGISPRYLCYVLKANNTSFSELLWKNRLPKARDWLVAPSTRDYPIHEIAYMSGFKSAAHFSRMFKTAYGCPPREYRAAHMEPSIQEVELESVWDRKHHLEAA